ncbi:MAG: bifunctional (p)ppGpp synthetase/guanosine-3',5'-bis(diphosphate) 3'-pyrophosphohydrolase, partial [Pseudomonadales bacterium]|nr:bifunctional (p)ppGpp synthetase/guanosine-3',5'-bis(diphosphate) 3'-pyrophosphohydrolase [Pseudomonadales bacterium]
ALEVQIRTPSMHEEAELGVCAHWHYKEGTQGGKDRRYEGKIAWLRQVLEWQEDIGESRAEDLASYFNQAIQDERIYVFTRDGHVVDLQAGSTPLDFAYHVHTEVGHACRGARVNGRIVPLTYALSTGDQVDIMTSQGGKPSRDWLNPSLGYLVTSRAMAKVRHWFKMQDRDQNLEAGQDMLTKELERLDLSLGKIDLNPLAARFNLKSRDDLLVALGAGDVSVQQVVNLLADLQPRQQDLLPETLLRPSRRREESDVVIEGVGNLLTTLAKCCRPVRGEAIAGYITQGRGVTVHAAECPELRKLQEHEPERIVAVSWSAFNHQPYPVDVFILAYDRTGLLRDITAVLANEHVNVTGVQTHSDKSDGTATMRLVIEVSDLDVLGRVLNRIAQQPNVIEARRIGNYG